MWSSTEALLSVDGLQIKTSDNPEDIKTKGLAEVSIYKSEQFTKYSDDRGNECLRPEPGTLKHVETVRVPRHAKGTPNMEGVRLPKMGAENAVWVFFECEPNELRYLGSAYFRFKDQNMYFYNTDATGAKEGLPSESSKA